jgi:UDP-N-acetylmuramoyl-L-alanyl-D-glutamate--2,6-diaminopimelate ligase
VKEDGNTFITDAIKNGAAAVLSQSAQNVSVPVIVNDNARRTLSVAAARFYDKQPKTVVAVTGTNGKTSTAHFTQQLWAANGYRSASLGTLGVHGAGIDRSGSMTTPDSVTLHAELAELADAGIDHLAMEASSHGLDQYRLDGVRVSAAGFTNLTLDHLDYHGTMDLYRAAKLRLFTEVLQPDGVAVLNADVAEFAAFKAASGQRRVIDYGHKAAALRIEKRRARMDGQQLDIAVNGKSYRVDLKLVGEFMAMNVLCALGMVMAEDNGEHYIAALPSLRGAPGRLQLVDGPSKGAIYVDYAHTPDALEHVLKALRPHAENRLIVITGCGGDRDKTKRPIMGRLAGDLADVAIITDDNPRSENPADIRAAMLAGAGTDAMEIGDRREAIRRGVAMVQDGDILVIAGKGHEQGQIIGGTTYPFDDVKEAQAAIEGAGI